MTIKLYNEHIYILLNTSNAVYIFTRLRRETNGIITL